MLRNNLFMMLLIAGCSSIKPISAPKQEVAKKEVFSPAKLDGKIGEVVRVSFPKNLVQSQSFLECDGDKLGIFSKDNTSYGFVAISYFSKLKTFSCELVSGQQRRLVATVKVHDKDFPSERLKVDQKRVSLNAKDLKRVRAEQVFLNQNYASSPAYPLFDQPFALPISNIVTSIYGSRRLFNHQKQTQHLGTDYRAAIGEPIYAANSGRVVVSRDLFFTGKTVTIDHGLNIFTIYGHLSRLDVKEGDTVKIGQVIGLSGATGRVTGPHLHWGVKVNGHFIEGDSLVRESSF